VTGWLARAAAWRDPRRAFAVVGTKTLVVLLIVATFGWAFAELADEVIEGDSRAIDEAVLLALRDRADPADPLGPPWVEEVARDVTALGGYTVLGIITTSVAGLLWLQGNHRTMVLLVVAVVGGVVVSTLFKLGFDRPRPDLVPHGAQVFTASFPSGHSMMAAVAYLTLAVLSARVQARWVIKAYLIALAALITVAVGVSRIYLGVHWPSDVVAGWCAGAAWALSCWLAARGLSRVGAVEPEGGAAGPEG
jgi:undecaprenyl-diphosphatase